MVIAACAAMERVPSPDRHRRGVHSARLSDVFGRSPTLADTAMHVGHYSALLSHVITSACFQDPIVFVRE
jgi:hypothetical protein